MKHAHIAKSERLQRVEALLMDGLEYSTMEIIQRTYVCAVNSIISELRANGYDIQCQRRNNKWFYRMNNV